MVPAGAGILESSYIGCNIRGFQNPPTRSATAATIITTANAKTLSALQNEYDMGIFSTTKPLPIQIDGETITISVRDDLSVAQAITYQRHCDAHPDDNFERGIAMLVAYVDGWQIMGADQAAAWGEATLRRIKLSVFEALVLAVSELLSPAPAQDPETDEGSSSPNA